MGRNKLSVEIKKQQLNIKINPWVKDWLKAQPRSQGVVIEEALIKAHKLKEPKKG